MEKLDDNITFKSIADRLASGLGRSATDVQQFRHRIEREWHGRLALNRELFTDIEVLYWQDELDLDRLRRVIGVFELREDFEYCAELKALLIDLELRCRPARVEQGEVSAETSI